MKLLLDTHILLWALTDSPKLPANAKMLIEDESNDVYYSIISPWEVEIKHLRHPDQMKLTGTDLALYCDEAGYIKLPVQIQNICYLKNLSRPDNLPKHQDPFDRMLIAQAATTGMMLITHDELIAGYTDQPIMLV